MRSVDGGRASLTEGQLSVLEHDVKGYNHRPGQGEFAMAFRTETPPAADEGAVNQDMLHNGRSMEYPHSSTLGKGHQRRQLVRTAGERVTRSVALRLGALKKCLYAG